MQIPSIPPPIVLNPLPQDAAAKAVPHMQAVKPLVARSVDPSPKAEKFNQSRGRKDSSERRDGQTQDEKETKTGGSFDVSV